jgi:hypothetical protein
MSYAVVDRTGNGAFGRAEEFIFFTRILHQVQHLCDTREKSPLLPLENQFRYLFEKYIFITIQVSIPR